MPTIWKYLTFNKFLLPNGQATVGRRRKNYEHHFSQNSTFFKTMVFLQRLNDSKGGCTPFPSLYYSGKIDVSQRQIVLLETKLIFRWNSHKKWDRNGRVNAGGLELNRDWRIWNYMMGTWDSIGAVTVWRFCKNQIVLKMDSKYIGGRVG